MPITLTGFAQATIKNLNLVAKQNDPQLKLTPTGFLRLLLENNAMVDINNIEELRKGLKRNIKLRYLQRLRRMLELNLPLPAQPYQVKED